jgi:formylglycine-generating enzyme required for sulfatase activity
LIESLKAIPSNTVISGTSHKPQKSWWERLTEGQGIVIAAVVAGLFTLLAAWIALNGNNPPISTPEPTTIAQAETTEPSVPTETPTDTPTATLSVTEVEATIRAEMAAIQAEAQRNNEATQTAIAEADRLANESTTIAQTQTAESWTDTPTPDLRATAGARLTQDAQGTADAQAIVDRQQTDVAATSDTQGTATQSFIKALATISARSTMTREAIFVQQTQEAALHATLIASPENDPLISARRRVNSNDEWTPYVQEFDGVEMVLVPVGCFDMGSNDGDSDEQPVHEICFDEPFWIDRTEITQSVFERREGRKANENGFSGDNRPVENIEWFEARDFCALRDARLPTEAEWEYAARGPDELIYPWGNQFVAENVVYGDNSDSQTAIVGSRPAGASWVGAMDMSGNVWEWVSSLYLDYPYESDHESRTNSTDVRVLRGGSRLNNSTSVLRAARRNGVNPNNVSSSFGFRCALSYEQ